MADKMAEKMVDFPEKIPNFRFNRRGIPVMLEFRQKIRGYFAKIFEDRGFLADPPWPFLIYFKDSYN